MHDVNRAASSMKTFWNMKNKPFSFSKKTWLVMMMHINFFFEFQNLSELGFPGYICAWIREFSLSPRFSDISTIFPKIFPDFPKIQVCVNFQKNLRECVNCEKNNCVIAWIFLFFFLCMFSLKMKWLVFHISKCFHWRSGPVYTNQVSLDLFSSQ